MIDFIISGSGAIEVDVHVDTPTRKTPANNSPHQHFSCCQLLTESQMDIKIAVVHRLNLDCDCEILAAGTSAAKSRH